MHLFRYLFCFLIIDKWVNYLLLLRVYQSMIYLVTVSGSQGGDNVSGGYR